MRHKLLFFFLLALSSYSDEGKRLHYFEPLKDTKPTLPFACSIGDVYPNSPAEHAGLRPGDMLVGMQGKRIYGDYDVDVLKLMDSQAETKPMSVLRGRELVTLTARKLIGPGRGGFGLNYCTVRFGLVLGTFNVDSEATVRKALQIPQEQRLHGYETAFFDSLPVRVCHDLFACTMKAGVDRKEVATWVESFAIVFLHMSFEHYNAAAELMKAQKLAENSPSPFLRDLVTFYSRVATHPPTADDFPHEKYNATPAFIAMCYPYPLCVLESSAKAFAGLPRLRKHYLAVHEGTAEEREKARKKGGKWKTLDRNSETYLTQVQAALIDNRRHGGWPYRSWLLSKDGQREIIADLKQRLQDKPDEKMITAFALLCPSMQEGDMDAFRLGYRTICEQGGSREIAIADGLIRFAVGWGNEAEQHKDRIRRIQAKLRPATNIPALYRSLAEINAQARYRVRNGVVWNYSRYRHSSGFRDARLMLYCALTEPVELDKVNAVVRAAVDSQDPEQLVQAGRQLVARMASTEPTAADTRKLCNLFNFLPADKATDLVIRLLAFHGEFDCRSYDIRPVYFKLRNHMLDHVTAAEQRISDLAADDPELSGKVAAILADVGTPPVQLMLAHRLEAIGKHDLAVDIRRSTRWYYGLLVSTYNSWGWKRLRERIAYELTLAPGNDYAFDHIERHLRESNLASVGAFIACKRAQRGEWQSAVDELCKGLKKKPKGNEKGWEIYFQGKIYDSNKHDYPVALAESWLRGTAITDAARAELSRFLELWRKSRKAPEMAQTSELFAVPAEKAIRVDGSLDEWDLSAVRQHCEDLRLYKDSNSVRVALTYDADALYVGLHVKDKSPLRNQACRHSAKNGGWNGDCAQIRFLVNDLGYNIDCWKSKHGRNLLMFYTSGGNDSPIGASTKFYQSPNSKLGDGFEASFNETANGYIQEIRIPWLKLNERALIANESFRMLVQMNWGNPYRDHTFTGNVRKGVKTHNEIWRTPADYGLVILSPKGKMKLNDPKWMQALTKGRLLSRQVLARHTQKIKAVSFLPGEGYRLVTASTDGLACIWDIQADKVLAELKHDGPVNALACSADGKLIATACDNGLILWDASNGKRLRTLTGHSRRIYCLAFVPGSNRIASASLDKSLRLWNVETGEEVGKWSFKRGIRTIAFSPDGKRAAVGCLDRKVYLFNVADGKQTAACVGHTFGIRDVAFSPDGKLLASVSDDMTARVWDVVSGKPVGKPMAHASLATGVEFIHEDALLTCSQDGSLRLWNARDGKERKRLLDASPDGIWAMALSPDASLLAYGDNSLKVKLLALED